MVFYYNMINKINYDLCCIAFYYFYTYIVQKKYILYLLFCFTIKTYGIPNTFCKINTIFTNRQQGGR